jgi:Spy/CpxP family protein refolding chaperone
MRVQLLAVTGALVVAGAVVAMGAQGTGTKGQSGRVERAGRADPATLKAELGLSAEQAAQLQKLRDDGRKQAIRQRADLSIARIELEEAMDAPTVDEKLVASRVKAVSDLEASALQARTNQRLAMRRLLTPEQLEKMKQMKRQGRVERVGERQGRRSGHQGSHGTRPPAGPGGPWSDTIEDQPEPER